MIGSESKSATLARSFTWELRRFSRDRSLPRNADKFLKDLKKLRNTALDIGTMTSEEQNKFKITLLAPVEDCLGCLRNVVGSSPRSCHIASSCSRVCVRFGNVSVTRLPG